MHSEHSAVKAYLERLPRDTLGLVQALRKLIKRVVPKAVETVVWDSLSYHRSDVGGRVKGAVCQICVRKGVVRLDFIHGIRLLDPDRLLRGDQMSKRFVPISSEADVTQPGIQDLIQQAAHLDPAEWVTA